VVGVLASRPGLREYGRVLFEVLKRLGETGYYPPEGSGELKTAFFGLFQAIMGYFRAIIEIPTTLRNVPETSRDIPTPCRDVPKLYRNIP
jgi:hypothetical protein